MLFWLYGRDMIGNSQAAFDLARLSGKVPDWTMVAVPVVAVAVLAAVTGYLAFGRHLAVKLIGVAVVVIALAAPGLALGWANGTVSAVGGQTHGRRRRSSPRREEQPASGAARQGHERAAHRLGQERAGRPGPLGHADPRAPRPGHQEHLDALDAARPAHLHPRRRLHQDERRLLLRRAGRLAVKTFSTLTGLPINHFVEINFAGFWHVVDILGGIYIPVDHRYYNPPGRGWKSIDLQPGYQLVHGKQALNFVRFRHDQAGDFTRMQRQQLFLKEMQRQSGRWSQDWSKIAQAHQGDHRRRRPRTSTRSSASSRSWSSCSRSNTSKINTVHLEGATPMIGGVSYVVASQAEIDQAVNEFTHPAAAPLKVKDLKLTKKMYPIRIYNGSGIGGLATTTANQLSALGYTTVVGADATEFAGKTTTIYAPQSLSAPAQLLSEMLYPSNVQIVARAPGVADGITVVLASSFDGKVNVPTQQTGTTTLVSGKYSASSWRSEAQMTTHPAGDADQVVVRLHLRPVPALPDQDDVGQERGRHGGRRGRAAGRLLGHPGDALAQPAGDPEPQ